MNHYLAFLLVTLGFATGCVAEDPRQQADSDQRGLTPAASATLPQLSGEQQLALIKEAQQTFSRHVRRDPQTRGDSIPSELWGPTMQSLKPLRVIDDRVNIKIVLHETAEKEFGFYINLPISSYFPFGNPNIKLTPVRSANDITWGQLYQFEATRERGRNP